MSAYLINLRGELVPIPRGGKPVVLPPTDPAVWGPPLWQRLHTGARTAATPEQRRALLEEISAAIPPLCACRRHWQAILAARPPQVDDVQRFFAWTVAAHNEVRARKKQPLFTLAEAEALYPLT